MTITRKLQRAAIAIVLLILVTSAINVYLVVAGIHMIVVKNESESEIRLSTHVIDMSLTPSVLKPHDVMVRLSSIADKSGVMWIDCTETGSGFKNKYGLGYVSYGDSEMDVSSIDGCLGMTRRSITRLSLGHVVSFEDPWCCTKLLVPR